MSTFFINESGQGMAEYGLILALIAIACITALSVYGGGVKGLYERSIGEMPW
ncbi:MAG: Flp family type IVb pilin [Mogibacterium sp.]|nr:Flp family type IVb pilin [Blautia sp.]MCF0141150.1 Flp family type IVb pilin [Mogibacterium sp.]